MNNYRTYEDIINVDNYDLCEALEDLDADLTYEPIRYRRTKKSRKDNKKEEE